MKNCFCALMAFAALLASGCSHTVEGVQQDAQQNAPVVRAVTQEAGQAIDQADKSSSAAVASAGVKLTKLDKDTDIALLTPEIKTEIIADKAFDSTRNRIDVDSSAKGVYLRGHVIDPGLKAKAGQIAENVISKSHLSIGLHDQLIVVPG